MDTFHPMLNPPRHYTSGPFLDTCYIELSCKKYSSPYILGACYLVCKRLFWALIWPHILILCVGWWFRVCLQFCFEFYGTFFTNSLTFITWYSFKEQSSIDYWVNLRDRIDSTAWYIGLCDIHLGMKIYYLLHILKVWNIANKINFIFHGPAHGKT